MSASHIYISFNEFDGCITFYVCSEFLVMANKLNWIELKWNHIMAQSELSDAICLVHMTKYIFICSTKGTEPKLFKLWSAISQCKPDNHIDIKPKGVLYSVFRSDASKGLQVQ